MNISKKRLPHAVASITFSAFLLVQPVFAQETNNRMSMFVSDSNTGYIDNAVINTRAQLRYDNARNSTVGDRAEFFYAECGCYRVLGLNPEAPGPSGKVSGTPNGNSKLIETSLDYQDLRFDYEHAFSRQFSLFAELPMRFIDGEVIGSTEGIADIRLGLKWGLLDSRTQHLTFQLKTYLPTGDAEEALGTDHYSIEPGLLYFGRLDEHWTLAAELRYWIPIDGASGLGTPFPDEDYAGEVLRSGLGIGYDFVVSEMTRVTPVVELVNWIVMGGQSIESADGSAASAVFRESDGDTITNIKVGVRVAMGNEHSVYVGYGSSLTDDEWYEDIIRMEYRRSY